MWLYKKLHIITLIPTYVYIFREQKKKKKSCVTALFALPLPACVKTTCPRETRREEAQILVPRQNNTGGETTMEARQRREVAPRLRPRAQLLESSTCVASTSTSKHTHTHTQFCRGDTCREKKKKKKKGQNILFIVWSRDTLRPWSVEGVKSVHMRVYISNTELFR